MHGWCVWWGNGARVCLLLQSEPAGSAPAPAPPATVLLHTDTRVLSKAELRADAERCADAERRLPSLLLSYRHKHQKDQHKFLKKRAQNCVPFPSIYDLEIHNTYWQTIHLSDSVFHVFGAYMDARNTSQIGPVVRILAVHDRIQPRLTTYCQLWFEPNMTKVLDYYAVQGVVTMTPNLPGLQHMHLKKKLNHKRRVVTMTPVTLPGVQPNLLSLQHIYLKKKLNHKRRVVTVTPVTLPGVQPNLPGLQHMYLKKKLNHKRQMELTPYNDCLYRHMYEFRWLALLDIDEVIVPLEDADWAGLIKNVEPLATPAPGKPARSSYHASNLDLLGHQHGWDGVPQYMHMLQHVTRTKNFTKPGHNFKAFHETDRVLALHNHFPQAWLGGACSTYALDTRTARLQHYRADCVSALMSCRELKAEAVHDEALWRWREPLVTCVDTVLCALSFLPPLPHR